MRRSIRKFNIPPPPRATPRAFELLKIGLFKFPPSGQKSRSNVPPISTELPLLKGKFHLQSNTLITCLSERDTP